MTEWRALFFFHGPRGTSLGAGGILLSAWRWAEHLVSGGEDFWLGRHAHPRNQSGERMYDGTIEAIDSEKVVFRQEINDPLRIEKFQRLEKWLHPLEEGQ